MTAALSPATVRYFAEVAAERARRDAEGELNAAMNAVELALSEAIRDGDGVGAAEALAAMKKAAADLFEVVA